MKYYNSYMERQEISRETHGRLLALGEGWKAAETKGRAAGKQHWRRWTALAACCALVLGLGVWRAAAPEQPGGETVQDFYLYIKAM